MIVGGQLCNYARRSGDENAQKRRRKKIIADMKKCQDERGNQR